MIHYSPLKDQMCFGRKDTHTHHRFTFTHIGNKKFSLFVREEEREGERETTKHIEERSC